MAIPPSVEHVTVSSGGPITLPDGTPVKGKIHFTAPRLNVVPPDDYVFGSTATVTLENGAFVVTLVAPDADGADPTGWTYEVRTEFTNASNWTSYMALTKDEPEVFLSDVLDPEAIDPTFDSLYLALSGGTMTGPVVFGTAGMDVDVQDAFAGTLSTGILRGGEVNPGGPGTITVSALEGYIVDTFTDPFNPTAQRITAGSQVIALDAGSLARSVSWFLMAADGSIVQQADVPSPEQRRTHLTLGVIVYNPGTGTILVDQSAPTILSQPANQFLDLLYALGPFVINGILVSPNGTNLALNLSAGQMFAPNFHHFDGPTLTQSPHYVPVPPRTGFTFRRTTRNFAGSESQTTLVDPTQYDNNGTLTAVGGGTNSATIQRVWMAGNGLVGNDILVQYGQQVHASLAAAVAAIGGTPYVPATGVEGNTALIGHIAMIRTATNLSDPAQAVFVHAGKFATP